MSYIYLSAVSGKICLFLYLDKIRYILHLEMHLDMPQHCLSVPCENIITTTEIFAATNGTIMYRSNDRVYSTGAVAEKISVSAISAD